MLLQDGETEFVNFALECGFESSSLEAEVEPADAREERGHLELMIRRSAFAAVLFPELRRDGAGWLELSRFLLRGFSFCPAHCWSLMRVYTELGAAQVL